MDGYTKRAVYKKVRLLQENCCLPSLEEWFQETCYKDACFIQGILIPKGFLQPLCVQNISEQGKSYLRTCTATGGHGRVHKYANSCWAVFPYRGENYGNKVRDGQGVVGW